MFACSDCLHEGLIPKPAQPYAELLCARHREARAHERLHWVTKSMGSTIGELLDASGASTEGVPDLGLRTELELTGDPGQPLSRRDLGRVTDAIRWARDAVNPPAWPGREME